MAGGGCIKTVLILLGAALILFIALVAWVWLDEPPQVRRTADPTGKFRDWASAVEDPQCAHVSKDIYAKGGTVADAAVASLLCLGVVLPESIGIGGGFMALYFHKAKRRVYFLDAREAAPLAAHRDMFNGDKGSDILGPRGIAVPSALKGYRELLERTGSNVTQDQLFRPAIRIARQGFHASLHLEQALREKREVIYADKSLRKVYFDSRSNETRKAGDSISNAALAKTLRKLARSEDFVDEFYTGTLGEKIVKKIKKLGGILTEEDMANYTAIWTPPTYYDITSTYEIFSAASPGNGAVLSFALRLLDAYNQTDFPEDVKTYHRLVEIMKFAFAKRSHLGDPRFVNITDILEDMDSEEFAAEIREKINDTETLPISEYGGAANARRSMGTTHACFIGPNGDAISITSSLNMNFGSGVQVGGIVMNNQMSDFTTPFETTVSGLNISEANYIEPGKRPMSSMNPSIVTRNGEAAMLLGGSGGSQATSATLQVLFHMIFQNASLVEAITHSRIHHQYLPDFMLYEDGFDTNIINGLQSFGHETQRKDPRVPGSVIVGIARKGQDLLAAVDPRRGGGVIGGERKKN